MADVTPGRISRVSGPLVEADRPAGVAMSDVVELGADRIPGEVVSIRGATVSVQAYDYTGGLAVGHPVRSTGHPLVARLGPDLLGGVFDGLLRPLAGADVWLEPGSLRRRADRVWRWNPAVPAGAAVEPGGVLGTVEDAGPVDYRVLVPPGVAGAVRNLRPAGECGTDDPVATVGGVTVRLSARWPLRVPRPARLRLRPDEPLRTGQRVLDALFPMTLGGTAAVPGGFGTGKTLLLQQIAKWCRADVIVYVGCGERGNELADVLADFGRLVDPRTGRPLAERTVIIANTSNMPIMAREVSVYAGMTVAEYMRDMGHHAVVIADSTSRWAEALRELASRAGGLPGEEGYPASLGSALAAFYERAGRVVTLGGTEGSVSVIGAVSPPGGDTTEPVTARTEALVRTVWSLDRALAYARHYPAVGWTGSFARDADVIGAWWARNGDPGWAVRRAALTGLLAGAGRAAELAELVGAGALSDRDRVLLVAGRLARDAVLQQSALSANDSTCSAEKTAALMDAAIEVARLCATLVERGVAAERIEVTDFSDLLRAGPETGPTDATGVAARRAAVAERLARLQ